MPRAFRSFFLSFVHILSRLTPKIEASPSILTRTVTKSTPAETVTQQPAQTRLAPSPAPEEFVRSRKFSPGSAPTTAVEFTYEDAVEVDGGPQPSTIDRTVTVVERPRATRRVPRRSFWNW